MSSIHGPKIGTYQAGGVIAKGQAVKLDSTGKIVTVVSATTDKSIGVAQSVAAASGDMIEVALPGGEAKMLAKASIAAGDQLGHNADGSIQKVASANDRVIGYAMEAASANDLFAGVVQLGMATQTQS